MIWSTFDFGLEFKGFVCFQFGGGGSFGLAKDNIYDGGGLKSMRRRMLRLRFQGVIHGGGGDLAGWRGRGKRRKKRGKQTEEITKKSTESLGPFS